MFTATVITPKPVPESPWEPCRPVEFTMVYGAAHWVTAQAGEYVANVKTYPEPSHYGFAGGRISKLEIMKGGVRLWSYDRGLYLGFLDRAGREFLAALVSRFN